jgi:hypothetical protein
MANIETETLTHPDAPIDKYSLRDRVAETLEELSERQEGIRTKCRALIGKMAASREAIGPFCAEVGKGNGRIVILKSYEHDSDTNTFLHFFLSADGPMAIEVKFPADTSKEGLKSMISMAKLDRIHRRRLLPLIDNLCEREAQGQQDERSSAGLTADGYSFTLSLPPFPGRPKGESLVITSNHGQNPRIVPVTNNQFSRALFNSMDEFLGK